MSVLVYTQYHRESKIVSRQKKEALQVKEVHRKFGIWGLQGMENCDDDVFFCKHSKPLQQQKVCGDGGNRGVKLYIFGCAWQHMDPPLY